MSYDSWPNLATMFFEKTAELGDKPFLWSKHGGRWTSVSGNEAAAQAAALSRALAVYGVSDLSPSDALERAVLRLLASQHEPALRRRLVLGCIRRVHALARSGIHLGDDARGVPAVRPR